MALEPKDDIKFKWANIKVVLARAIVFTQARDVANGISGTTLQSSIADTIRELDSAEGGDLETLGAAPSAVILEEESDYGGGVNKGKLQKVRDLQELFFGDEANAGLLDQLSELTDPDKI